MIIYCTTCEEFKEKEDLETTYYENNDLNRKRCKICKGTKFELYKSVV